MQPASVRATQAWTRQETQMPGMGPTLLEPGRDLQETLAPKRPRSVSVLPNVHLQPGGEVTLSHTDAERYKILNVLGEGGMGIVERAEDLDIGRPVAIKRLLPEASHALGIARFVSEIRIVGSLDHPNVVPIHDVGVDADGRYFFVMKYVEGQTLADIIDRLAAGDPATTAFWSFERRAELMIAVLQALDYAHERGVIHRDIKPENIMVGSHGEVRLMDWGIARRVDQPDPGEGTGLIGTPAYMSPEQAACARARPPQRHLLRRRHPPRAHRPAPLPRPPLRLDVWPHRRRAERGTSTSSASDNPLPPEMRHICSRGLAKDPAHRYTSAAAMIADIRAYVDGTFHVKCMFTFTKRALREPAAAWSTAGPGSPSPSPPPRPASRWSASPRSSTCSSPERGGSASELIPQIPRTLSQVFYPNRLGSLRFLGMPRPA
jgi:serine/threonine protein kinase